MTTWSCLDPPKGENVERMCARAHFADGLCLRSGRWAKPHDRDRQTRTSSPEKALRGGFWPLSRRFCLHSTARDHMNPTLQYRMKRRQIVPFYSCHIIRLKWAVNSKEQMHEFSFCVFCVDKQLDMWRCTFNYMNYQIITTHTHIYFSHIFYTWRRSLEQKHSSVPSHCLSSDWTAWFWWREWEPACNGGLSIEANDNTYRANNTSFVWRVTAVSLPPTCLPLCH